MVKIKSDVAKMSEYVFLSLENDFVFRQMEFIQYDNDKTRTVLRFWAQKICYI